MSYEFQDQVLGMVISQPKRYWPEVKNKWDPEAFGDLDRIKLATAIQELLNSDVEFNEKVIYEHLQGHASLMLLRIVTEYTREANIVWFLDQIVAWHNIKQLVPECGDLCQDILNSKNSDNPEKAITRVKFLYEKFEKAYSANVKIADMLTVIESTAKRIEDRIILKMEGKIRGYSFGMKKLDEYMAGLIGGRFYIIAARTSVGKTSFASWITLKAIKQGAKPLFFSNEMDKEDLMEKFIAAESKIATNKFQSGDLTDDELTRFAATSNELAKLKISIEEKAGWDLDTLVSTVHKLYRSGKCDMVVVDYLQQVRVKSAKSKYEQVSTVSDEMKKLSRELNIPVIGLAQINRESEKGPTKEIPSLSNLKDSGSLEQDADVVMILHKNDIADMETILSIAKNRYGMTGAIKIKHTHKFNTYEGA
jgi:replicative DNA helicase